MNHIAAPSPARMSAAVARVCRCHAQASPLLSRCFGEDSAVVLALRGRLDALQEPVRMIAELQHAEFPSPFSKRQQVLRLPQRAANLRQLVISLAAVTEVIEAENDDAAKLRVRLDGIVKECEFIIAATAEKAAA